MKTVLVTPLLLLVTYACFAVEPARAGEPTSSAPAAAAPGTPDEALRVYLQAIKDQDVASFKKSLSKSGMEVMEEKLASQKITPAELLKSMAADGLLPEETSDEKITGDTATVDVKRGRKEGEWTIVAMIKENGSWKIALGNWETESPAKDKPMDTWLTYREALDRGNAEMMEKCIAPGPLDKFKHNEAAITALGQALTSLQPKKAGDPLPMAFPTRNQEISADGKTATLEVKDATRDNRWVRIHFIKGDDGKWKLTFTPDQMGKLVPGELLTQG